MNCVTGGGTRRRRPDRRSLTKADGPGRGRPLRLYAYALPHSTLTVQAPSRRRLHHDRRHAQTDGRPASNDEKRDPHGALFHLPDKRRTAQRVRSDFCSEADIKKIWYYNTRIPTLEEFRHSTFEDESQYIGDCSLPLVPNARLDPRSPMKFTGDIAIVAPREAVFAKVRDARFFASCVEGVQNLSEIDSDHYTAVLETKIAYLKFKFDVAVEVLRIDPPNEIEARIEGTPSGIVGRLSARSLTRLAEENGGTRVSYEIEAALTGKLGSLGQPVLRAKAKEMERQFAERIRAAFPPVGSERAP